MQSTTANNVQHLTAEEQLDVLWKALQSPNYWVDVNQEGVLILSTITTDDFLHRTGSSQRCFKGSRRSVIEQLHALQVSEALDDPKPVTDDIVDVLRPAVLQVMSGANDVSSFGVPVIKTIIDC